MPNNADNHRHLPLETWEVIFRKLDSIDLTKCQQTCRLFKTLISTSTTLQHHVLLMQNGLIEIANGGLALRERVTLLRRRRRVWTWLDWLGDVPEVPMENYYEILDLSGGKLHLALESAVLSYSFPSALEPTKYVLPPQCQELQVAPTMRVTSIAADESQDLIILLTYVFSMEDVTEGSNAAYSYYLLFKSPSTMTDHGDAHFSQLGLTANEVGEKGTLMLMKDHVALFSGDLLSIWNWKTGVKVTTHRPAFDLACSFAFIDAHTYLFCTVNADAAYIGIYAVGTGAEIRRLMLPALHALNLAFCECHSRLAQDVIDGLFVPDPDDRLFVFYFTLQPAASAHSTRFPLATLARTLLSAGWSGPIVPWEEWGPRHTRMFQDKYRFTQSSNSLFGSRIACQSVEDSKVFNLTVLDFNPSASAEYMSITRPGPSYSTVDVPTLFVDGPVTTSLHFTATNRQLSNDWDLSIYEAPFVMDGQRIFRIGVRGDSSRRYKLR